MDVNAPESCFICDEPGVHNIQLAASKKLPSGMVSPPRRGWVCDKHQRVDVEPEAQPRGRRKRIRAEEGQHDLFEGAAW